MIGTATITFSVSNSGVIYEVPEKVHLALQKLAEMQKQRKYGSITLHLADGNVAKVEIKHYL